LDIIDANKLDIVDANLTMDINYNAHWPLHLQRKKIVCYIKQDITIELKLKPNNTYRTSIIINYFTISI